MKRSPHCAGQHAEIASSTITHRHAKMATDGLSDHVLLRAPSALRFASDGFLDVRG